MQTEFIETQIQLRPFNVMPDKKSLIKRLSIKTIKIAMGELQNKNKKCQVCGKEFTKIFNLKQHLLIHGTKKGKKTQSSKKD